MKRFLLAAGALALAVAVTVAQDPKTDPTQPDSKAAKGNRDTKAAKGGGLPGEFQPTKDGGWPTLTTRVTPARMAALEEEFETIEAHREVRKAHVRAAEVAVKAAEVNLEIMAKGGANIAQQELMKAKLEVDAAK